MSRDAERDAGDIPGGTPHPESGALTSELRDQLRYVEGQLEAERQAHAEARRLLAAALERIPAIEAPHEASEDAETVEETPERAENPGPLRKALRRAHSGGRGGKEYSEDRSRACQTIRL